jgi:hypothetical protein
MCPFCDQVQESDAHISLFCTYAKEVWHSSPDFGHVAGMATSSTSLSGWWVEIWKLHNNKVSRPQATVAVYVVWNLWKERNRRVFESKVASPLLVGSLARDELNLFELACKL